MRSLIAVIVIALVLQLVRRAIAPFLFPSLRPTPGSRPKIPDRHAEFVAVTRTTEPPWIDAAGINKLVEPLIAAGFVELGVYVFPAIPGICIEILVHGKTNVIAHIYEHPLKPWVELVTNYEDGTSIMFSTLPRRTDDRPSWAPNVPLPEGPSDELYRRLLRERKSDGIRLVDRTALEQSFERANANLIMWRQDGEISAEEIERSITKWTAEHSVEERDQVGAG